MIIAALPAFRMQPCAIGFAQGFAVAALSMSVEVVVGACAKEHVQWIAAGAIVAVMAHAESLWNRDLPMR